MSEPITILCRERLSRADVAAFILQRGGRVHEQGNEVGAVSDGKANVWIFFDPEETGRASAMEDIGEALLARLGGPYGSSLTLEVSKAEESATLALDLAIACCERWSPAFVSDAADALLSLDERVAMRTRGRTFNDIQNEWLARQGLGDAT